MWGYPEFYIPVPGGYGTESHGHVGGGHQVPAGATAHAMHAESGDIAMTCTCVKPVPVERATRKGAAHTECAECGKQIRLTLGKGRRFGAVSSQPT